MQPKNANYCQEINKSGDSNKRADTIGAGYRRDVETDELADRIAFSWSSIIAGFLLATLISSGGNCFASESVPPDAEEVSQPTLQIGSKGTAVSKLQAALKLLGYYIGEVDGVYGKTTAESVSKFQQAAGLTPDGIAGETTWKRLFPTSAITATPSPSPTATPKPSPSSIPIPTPQSDSEAALPSDTDLPTLRLGMRGEAVTGLQQRLKSLGLFSQKIDGVFGAKTEMAVKEAQKKFKIKPDGIVGKTTWAAILR